MARFKATLRRITPQTEFAIVLIAAFGVPMIAVGIALVAPQLLRKAAFFSNAQLVRTIAYEVALLLVLGCFLLLRGWSLERLGLSTSKRRLPDVTRTVGIGIGIAVAAYLMYLPMALLFRSMWPRVYFAMPAVPLVKGPLAPVLVVAASLINPIFEETFVCGYVITALRERIGVTAAINVSSGIRVAYHLYQGTRGLLGITPFAFIIAYWFARTRRLWPAIVAHALTDFVALWALRRFAA